MAWHLGDSGLVGRLDAKQHKAAAEGGLKALALLALGAVGAGWASFPR